MTNTSHASAVCWNRHLPTCTGFSGSGKRCSKCNGSAAMAQRNVFAASVNMALMGSTGIPGTFYCPLARNADGSPVVFSYGESEVDRTVGQADYAPGVVVLTSREGNQLRSRLQREGRDIEGVTNYQNAVLAASQSVDVLPLTEAHAAWSARPMTRETHLAAW